MNTRNSREEFQNIIRSSVFIYIIHKTTNGYRDNIETIIENIETVRLEFLHSPKKVLGMRGRLFQQIKRSARFSKTRIWSRKVLQALSQEIRA